MPDSALWAHILYSDGIAVVGLRSPGANRGVYRGRLLINASDWLNSRAAIANTFGVQLISADSLLPSVKVRFESFASFQDVRRLPFTDYVEPLRAIGDIEGSVASSGGCGSVTAWPEGDRFRTVEGDVYSIKHREMGIEYAWLRSGGAGVNIGLIDTGIHGSQQQLLPTSLGGYFDTGRSAGRWIKYRSAWTSQSDASPTDPCGHGTEMAGVMTAARDGRSAIGIAWQSNLVSSRHADGVLTVGGDDAQNGIRAAAWALDPQPGGKIIVMAWGSNNWWWQVSNEIDYWRNRHPTDLIFFGAAGTSAEDWKECAIAIPTGALVGTALGALVVWVSPLTAAALWLWTAVGTGAGYIAGCIAPNNQYVVFPAAHSGVIAVTCLDHPIGNVSNNCHFGDKVEFGAYQLFPTVYGSSSEVDGIAGSSSAVAVVAAQAALVWSKYPSMTQSEVLARMRWAGWSKKDPHAGWGIVNTYKAVGGMYNPRITSVGYLDRYEVADPVTLSASVLGGTGPFAYSWSNGSTSRTTTVNPTYYDDGMWRARIDARVTITDLSDGTKVHAPFFHVFYEPASDDCPTCVQDPPDGGGGTGN